MKHHGLILSQFSEGEAVKFDPRRFHWIGSAEKDDMKLFTPSDAPFQSVRDLVKAKQAPRCGSTGVGSSECASAFSASN
jgi:tripartite-type tricarboxylate transporter receptor subunit TctC